MQDLYAKNYTILMKEIKDDLNKWRNMLCSWIARLSIVKMLVILKLICRFNAIPIQIPASFFVGIDKIILRFIGKDKITRI